MNIFAPPPWFSTLLLLLLCYSSAPPLQAWRAWSKKLCHADRWLLLLCPVFLLLFTVSVMTVTLPLPAPPVIDVDRRSSRALSSAGGFRSRPAGVMEPPPATDVLQSIAHIHNIRKESEFKVSVASIHKTNVKREQEENEHRSKATAGVIQHRAAHHHRPRLPQFIVNNTRPKQRIIISEAVKLAAQTYVHREVSRSTEALIPAGRREQRLTHRNADAQLRGRQTGAELAVGKHGRAAKHSGKSIKTSKEQRAVKKTSRYLRKHNNTVQRKKNPRASDYRSRCQSRFTELDFPDDDRRRVRVRPRDVQPPVTWLSEDDVQKMELLAGGEVVSKARVPAHGQVLQVALEPPVHGKSPLDTHDERCHRGRCSLVKRTDDWFEVFAFHLDRVLGLNRSLPAVLRTFHSEVLPYRYIGGSPRPVLWWDPDIQHLTDRDNDQNSVPLSWVQYQNLLRLRCGDEADLRSAPCVGVQHSEWGRLALFDFLLQVRKADPSRLVFIDNAGRPQQTTDNLNFRLVEGIDEFPEEAVAMLQSGCLESRLLRSLYTDRELWESRGGVSGLRPLVRTVEQRGKILLRHIRDRKLQPQRDL
uniref:Golgi associated kinase 1A n=1 Tax=Scophthalmus maximus TaxID=52904 RepID=A0A8D3CX64_SCOMX